MTLQDLQIKCVAHIGIPGVVQLNFSLTIIITGIVALKIWFP